MIKKLTILFILVHALVLSACGQSGSKAYHTMLNGLYSNTVPVISPAALHQKLTQKSKSQVILLDTRTKQEFDVSHLPNARFVGYDEFDLKQLQRVPKNAKLVVYCSVGYRSEKIGEKLKKAGYTNVYNLYGGIFEWVNGGFAVYDAQGPTQKVHAYSKAWGIWLNKGEKVYE